MPTVNETLQAASVSHQTGLLRYGTGIVSEISALFDEAREELAKELERRLQAIVRRGFDTGPVTTQRVAAQLTQLGRLNEELHRQMGEMLQDSLEKLAPYEVDFQARMLTGALPITASYTLPGPEQLKALITELPFNGRFYGEHISDLSRAQFKNISRTVQIGVVNGRTLDQIVRQVVGSKQFNYSNGVLTGRARRAQVESVVRTSVNHVATQSRELLYKDNDDLIKGVQWVSTLDGRTTLICQTLDGRVYKIGEGERPPAHYSCRSTTAPVVKSLSEIGATGPDITDDMRASMNGQVAAKTTYGDWLRSQSVGVQNLALGNSRAAIFRANPQMALDQLGDAFMRPLTLRQLAVKEAALFKKLPIEELKAIEARVGGRTIRAIRIERERRIAAAKKAARTRKHKLKTNDAVEDLVQRSKRGEKIGSSEFYDALDPKEREKVHRWVRQAEGNQDEYEKLIRGVADQLDMDVGKFDDPLPNTYFFGPLKKAERIAEKAILDYSGRVDEVADVLRMTYVVRDPADARKVYEALKRADRPVGLKDRLLDPATGGYRDMIFKVTLQDGTRAEVQINLRQMLLAKNGKGHKLYDEMRTLVKGSPRWNELLRQSEEHYGKAWGKICRDYPGFGGCVAEDDALRLTLNKKVQALAKKAKAGEEIDADAIWLALDEADQRKIQAYVQRAQRNQPEYERLVQLGADEFDMVPGEFADPKPGTFFYGPLKKAERIAEKAVLDYGGNLADVGDVLRMTYVLKDPEDGIKLYAKLKKADSPTELKDRFLKPIAGYRDQMFKLELPDGMKAEIQVNMREMLIAKNGKGHKIYDKMRVLAKDDPEFAKLLTESQEFYGRAWTTICRQFPQYGGCLKETRAQQYIVQFSPDTNEVLKQAKAGQQISKSAVYDSLSEVDKEKVLNYVARAEANEAEFRKVVDGVARRVGYKITDYKNPQPEGYFYGPLKKAQRIAEKGAMDHGGNLERVGDVLRMTYVVDDPADADKIYRLLQELDDPAKYKNRFLEPLPTGYRDTIMKLTLRDGMQAEVQINTRQMLLAKGGDGHKFYDRMRVLPKGDPEWQELLNRSQRLYGEAWRGTCLRHPAYGGCPKAKRKFSQLANGTFDGMGDWEQATGRSLKEYLEEVAAVTDYDVKLIQVQKVGNQIGYEYHLLDEAGDSVVRASRMITPGGAEVTHHLLYMSKEIQGLGLGKRLLGFDMKFYQEVGVSNIKLLADEVGGYAWARYGFGPRTPDAWKVLKGQLQHADTGLSKLPKNAVKFLDEIFEMDDGQAALWRLADEELLVPSLEDADKLVKLGKRALIGQHWQGQLDLSDARAMERFWEYLGETQEKRVARGRATKVYKARPLPEKPPPPGVAPKDAKVMFGKGLLDAEDIPAWLEAHYVDGPVDLTGIGDEVAIRVIAQEVRAQSNELRRFRGIGTFDGEPSYNFNQPIAKVEDGQLLLNRNVLKTAQRLDRYQDGTDLGPLGSQISRAAQDAIDAVEPDASPAVLARLDEAETWARQNGAPTLAEGVDDAARTLVDRTIEWEEIRFRAGKISQENYDDFQEAFSDRSQVVANWKEKLKGSRIGEVDKEKALRLQEAINENHQNPVYRAITDAAPDDQVVLLRKTSRLTAQDDMLSAERIANSTSLMYADDRGYGAWLKPPDTFKPGHATAFEGQGIGGIVRHEFGHSLEKIIPDESAEKLRTIRHTVGKDEVENGLTFYANHNDSEFFSELFAVITDPKYRRADWPEWVNEAGDVLKDGVAKTLRINRADLEFDDAPVRIGGDVLDLRTLKTALDHKTAARHYGDPFEMDLEDFEDLLASPLISERRDETLQAIGKLIDEVESTEMAHRTGVLREGLPNVGKGSAYSEARQELHEEILEHFLRASQSLRDDEQPTLTLVGGGPSVGKSTAIKEGRVKLPSKDSVAVNADSLKSFLPEYQQALRVREMTGASFVHNESSDLSTELISRAFSARRNILYDTTGGKLEKMQEIAAQARRNGYRVVADYQTLPTDDALHLMRGRAAKTGRRVPEEIVVGTHQDVSTAFADLVRLDVFDDLRLWDNTVFKKQRLIAEVRDGKLHIEDTHAWKAFLDKGGTDAHEAAARLDQAGRLVIPDKAKGGFIGKAEKKHFPHLKDYEFDERYKGVQPGAQQLLADQDVDIEKHLAQLADDTDLDVAVLNAKLDDAGDSVTYEYLLVDKNGDSVGGVTSSVTFGDDPYVYLQRIDVAPHLRGRGVGKQILRREYELAQQLKVASFQLEAADDVGGYAWARFGFRPTAKWWDNIRDPDYIPHRFEAFSGSVSAATRATVKEIFESDDRSSLWRLVDLRDKVPVEKATWLSSKDLKRLGLLPEDEIELGKALMLQSKWWGDLDFSDARSMERFQEYIGSSQQKAGARAAAKKAPPPTPEELAVEAFKASRAPVDTFQAVFDSDEFGTLADAARGRYAETVREQLAKGKSLDEAKTLAQTQTDDWLAQRGREIAGKQMEREIWEDASQSLDPELRLYLTDKDIEKARGDISIHKIDDLVYDFDEKQFLQGRTDLAKDLRETLEAQANRVLAEADEKAKERLGKHLSNTEGRYNVGAEAFSKEARLILEGDLRDLYRERAQGKIKGLQLIEREEEISERFKGNVVRGFLDEAEDKAEKFATKVASFEEEIPVADFFATYAPEAYDEALETAREAYIARVRGLLADPEKAPDMSNAWFRGETRFADALTSAGFPHLERVAKTFVDDAYGHVHEALSSNARQLLGAKMQKKVRDSIDFVVRERIWDRGEEITTDQARHWAGQIFANNLEDLERAVSSKARSLTEQALYNWRQANPKLSFPSNLAGEIEDRVEQIMLRRIADGDDEVSVASAGADLVGADTKKIIEAAAKVVDEKVEQVFVASRETLEGALRTQIEAVPVGAGNSGLIINLVRFQRGLTMIDSTLIPDAMKDPIRTRLVKQFAPYQSAIKKVKVAELRLLIKSYDAASPNEIAWLAKDVGVIPKKEIVKWLLAKDVSSATEARKSVADWLKVHKAKKAAAAKEAREAAKLKVSDPTPIQQLNGRYFSRETGALGSNPGGTFVDQRGQRWYVKFPKEDTPESFRRLQEEMLAARLYQVNGVPVSEKHWVQMEDGRWGLANRWEEGLTQLTAEAYRGMPDVMDNFIYDAWMANWDVIGAVGDNILSIGGRTPGLSRAVRLDPGGALRYRAQGRRKGPGFFSNKVQEIATMRDLTKNKNAAAVFGRLPDEQLVKQMKAFERKMTPARIRKIVYEIVEQQPPGYEFNDPEGLIRTLISRRRDITKQRMQLEEKVKASKIGRPFSGTDYSSGTRTTEATKWADKNIWGQEGMTSYERNAFGHYSGYGAHEINKDLWINKRATKHDTVKWVRKLDEAYEKADPVEQPFYVYRGRDAQKDEMSKAVMDLGEGAVGMEFKQWGYASTAVHESGMFVSDVNFKIRIREGFSDAAWIWPISSHTGEFEVLLNRGLTFRIVKVWQDLFGKDWAELEIV